MFSQAIGGRFGRAARSCVAGSSDWAATVRHPLRARPPADGGIGRTAVLLALLGVAVVGLLVEGALRRSRSEPAEPLPSRPIFTGLVRPVLEKTPLVYESDYWAQLAQQVGPWLVALGAAGGVGVVVAPGEAIGALPRESAVTPSGRDGPATAAEGLEDAGGPRLIAVDLETSLALWRFDSGNASAPFPRSDPAFWGTAARVAAVTLAPDRAARIAPGYLAGLRRGEASGTIDATVPWSGAPAFAALVDIDGRLVAAGELRQQPAPWYAHGYLDRLLDRLRGAGPCRPIVVRDLMDGEREAAGGRAGVVVERVWADRFAARESLSRGDVLVEWDGQATASASAFEAAYDRAEVGASVRLRLIRGSRTLALTVRRPDRFCRPVIDPRDIVEVQGIQVLAHVAGGDGGAIGGGDARPWEVTGAGTDSPPEGLRAGDRILAIDGVPAGSAEARRRLDRLTGRTRTRAVLTVERDGGVMLVEVTGR